MDTTEYTPTIGLEVHAELKTETKMFCASRNSSEESAPNIHICPICMGHPGTLPVINKKAVEAVIMVGLAIGGKIATYTEFDRKNYFYPDIPKGYQISQYAYPLVSGGTLSNVAITRVHLEEDTARSLHDAGEGSLVDYNRAGVPLMELVTEPVIHDAKTAGDFARELQLLLRTLGVSEAHMERGHMRVEANISVGKGGALGTKVEVKNLNSFRSVESAIEYEIKRQKEVLAEGGKVVQETRGWDEVGQKTFSQRKKESSHDYRYFPDPDLPKINLEVASSLSISRISEMMPELPLYKRKKYLELGIPSNQIEVLVTNIEVGKFFELVVDTSKVRAPLAANYLTSDVQGLLSADTTRIVAQESVVPFGKLIDLLLAKEVTSRVAKDILSSVMFEAKDPGELIKEMGLGALDESKLVNIVDAVIRDNAQVVAEYKAGKLTSLQYLIGQVMRLSKGAANPETVKTLLTERLD